MLGDDAAILPEDDAFPAPEGERRYSPAECIGIIKTRVSGDPDMDHVSTSYAERNNLNVRMHTRRMTRLTNAFSKKMENHAHAMALHFLYYNFVRIHKTLKETHTQAIEQVSGTPAHQLEPLFPDRSRP